MVVKKKKKKLVNIQKKNTTYIYFLKNGKYEKEEKN